jgi:hypothetical protein
MIDMNKANLGRLSPSCLAVAGSLCLISTPSLAYDGPGPRLQQQGARVVSISRLTNGENCHPDTVEGRVVKRTFNRNEMMLENVVIETKDGSRELINIDEEEIGKALPSAQGVIVQGLQSLLKEGNRVVVRAFYCGASGRVAFLDSVREQGRQRR